MTRRFTEELAVLIWYRIDQETNEGISGIIAECENLTTTNCGWVAYGLKDLVLAASENILQLRQDAADDIGSALKEDVRYGTATLVSSAANEKSQEEELPF